MGDPAALVDLAELAEGGWQCPTADPDGRGIRVGFMSRLPLADVEQVRVFPAGLRPVQVDDTDTPISEMGGRRCGPASRLMAARSTWSTAT